MGGGAGEVAVFDVAAGHFEGLFWGVGRLEVGRLGWEGWGIKVVVVVVVVNGCAGVVGGFGCASAGWATGVLGVSLRSGTVPMNF